VQGVEQLLKVAEADDVRPILPLDDRGAGHPGFTAELAD